MSWVHFTNQPYPDLRRREEAILQAICSSAKPELQRQLLAVIQPWRPAKTLREEARELKLRLVESLAIPLFDALLDALERPTGLAIHASDVEHGLDTFLLVGDHGVRWTDARLDRLKALAERAREDPIIHENMVDFAARMREPISGFPEHPRRHVAELLWQGMIAQPLQYRSIGSHRQTKKFLERAVGESLPTPEWWDVLGPREDENTLST